jgi:hypothetical protein
MYWRANKKFKPELGTNMANKQIVESPKKPLTTLKIKNVGDSLYLQTYYINLGSTASTWNITAKSGIVALCNPRDSAAAGPLYNYLSADFRLGYPCTKTYCGLDEMWSQTYDSGTSSYSFKSVRWGLYLASGSTGQLVLSSTLDSASRWTQTTSGSNYLYKNYLYSTLYLRGNPDGYTVKGQTSSSPSSDHLCNWYVDGTRGVTIQESSTSYYLQSLNTVFTRTTDTTQPGTLFVQIPMDGSNYALQTFYAGYLTANSDNATVSEAFNTDPGKLPSASLWTFP